MTVVNIKRKLNQAISRVLREYLVQDRGQSIRAVHAFFFTALKKESSRQ